MNRWIVRVIVGWAAFSATAADGGYINFVTAGFPATSTFIDGELSVMDYTYLATYNIPANFDPSHLSLSFNVGPPATGSLSTGYTFGAGSLTLTGQVTPTSPVVTLVSGQLTGYSLFPEGTFYNFGVSGNEPFTLDPGFAAELGVSTVAIGFIDVAFTETSEGLVGTSINIQLFATIQTVVPEPPSFALLGIAGVLALAVVQVRRKRFA